MPIFETIITAKKPSRYVRAFSVDNFEATKRFTVVATDRSKALALLKRYFAQRPKAQKPDLRKLRRWHGSVPLLEKVAFYQTCPFGGKCRFVKASKILNEAELFGLGVCSTEFICSKCFSTTGDWQ